MGRTKKLSRAANDKYNEMVKMPVSAVILKLAFSTVLTMVIISIYGIIDMIFISEIGDTAVGACGIVFSITCFIQAAGYTFGMGAGSILARKLGEKSVSAASKATTMAFVSGIISGVVILAFGLIFLKPIMEFLGANKDNLTESMTYGRIIFIGAPIMCGAYVLNNTLRQEGKPWYTLFGITAGGVVNIVLDYLLISVWNMGISGAAWATVIGQAVSLIVMLLPYLTGKSIVKLTFARGKAASDVNLMGIISQGMPSFIRQICVAIAAAALSRQCRVFGNDAIAAMAIGTRIFNLFFSIVVGYGQSLAPVVGYSYGAGNKENRIKKAVRFTLITGVLFMTAAAVLQFIFAGNIAGCFQGSDNVLILARRIIRLESIAYPFIVVSIVAGVLYQAMGKYLAASVIYGSRQGILFMILIHSLPDILGFTGVILAQPAADILAALIFIIFL